MQYIERQAAEERPQGRRGSRKSDPRVPRLGAIMHVRKLQAQRRLQTQGGQEGRWLPQHLEMGCRAQLGARLRQWCATFGHCDIKLSPTIVSCFAHGDAVPRELQVRYVCSVSALPPSQHPALHPCGDLCGISVPCMGSQRAPTPNPALPSDFLSTEGGLQLVESLCLAPPVRTVPMLPDRGARVPVFYSAVCSD